MHGIGKLIVPNELIYEGEFFYSQKHGKGKQSEKNGKTYEGGFYFGKKHGKGTLIEKDGTTQECYYNNNVLMVETFNPDWFIDFSSEQQNFLEQEDQSFFGLLEDDIQEIPSSSVYEAEESGLNTFVNKRARTDEKGNKNTRGRY